jgi:hypothetical protein
MKVELRVVFVDEVGPTGKPMSFPCEVERIHPIVGGWAVAIPWHDFPIDMRLIDSTHVLVEGVDLGFAETFRQDYDREYLILEGRWPVAQPERAFA